MSTTVTYKGDTLATVSNDTVTLETGGTWLEDDITLTDVTSSATLGTKIITTNGTYEASDDGYDGYSEVTVNVSGGNANVTQDANGYIVVGDEAAGGGSTIYSGTYMSATRPTANVAFTCPGATHFLIRVANNETPDLTLGVAFMNHAYANTTYTTSIGSNNSGSSTNSTDYRYNTGARSNYYIGIEFTADGVEAIYYNHNYYKWFQAGLTYEWFAW